MIKCGSRGKKYNAIRFPYFATENASAIKLEHLKQEKSPRKKDGRRLQIRDRDQSKYK